MHCFAAHQPLRLRAGLCDKELSWHLAVETAMTTTSTPQHQRHSAGLRLAEGLVLMGARRGGDDADDDVPLSQDRSRRSARGPESPEPQISPLGCSELFGSPRGFPQSPGERPGPRDNFGSSLHRGTLPRGNHFGSSLHRGTLSRGNSLTQRRSLQHTNHTVYGGICSNC